jgi:hypothetical protein
VHGARRRARALACHTATPMRVLQFVILATALGCQQRSRATEVGIDRAAAEGPVALHNGRNAIDLLGDGTPAEVFVAWRGNFNAHGHSTVAIYVRARSDLGDSLPDWQIVPRFGGPDIEDSGGEELFGTTEGADCTLRDLRIVVHRGAPADLIVGRRELGKSYADSAATHFDYYRLTRNANGEIGRPPYYFDLARTVDAHRPYCDVNLAFDQELHLGRHGIGHGEASQ